MQNTPKVVIDENNNLGLSQNYSPGIHSRQRDSFRCCAAQVQAAARVEWGGVYNYSDSRIIYLYCGSNRQQPSFVIHIIVVFILPINLQFRSLSNKKSTEWIEAIHISSKDFIYDYCQLMIINVLFGN